MAQILEKPDLETIESLRPTQTYTTLLGAEQVSTLSQAHKDYLIHRHGTLELDPLPAFGDADPYNWPLWKKITNLVLVAFHACMGPFTGAAIIPAYADIAKDLSVSIQRVSYLTTLQIVILGIAPLFWRPIADRYGRRFIFLFSLIISLAGNIGCAKSPTFATMAVCRAIVAFGISPPLAIGSGVVAEAFFKKDRARYMGVWTLLITLGVPVAPFLFGFVAYNLDYRWIYWILAMINGGQLILYIFFGPETRYIRKGVEHEASNSKQEYLQLRRIDPRPLRAAEFMQPLILCSFPKVIIPAIAYAIVFLFANVMISVEIPQLFVPKFHFNPQQLGLQFLAIIIGSLIGEQFGGFMSDYWMLRRSRKMKAPPAPEFRLWISYLGFVLAISGVIIFLILFGHTKQGHWDVSAIVGSAIAAAGNQIVTTILFTYAIDCHTDQSSSIGVVINVVRQILGFVGPFWFPQMFENTGLGGSAGIASGVIFVGSVVPIIFIHSRGQRWH